MTGRNISHPPIKTPELRWQGRQSRQVPGSARTGDGTRLKGDNMARFLLVVVALAGCCGAELADVPYSVAPLGNRPDALDTIPLLVNNSQVILGFADVGIPSGLTPFLLSSSPPVAFPASPGNTLFSPQAINNSGAMAGFLMPDAANPLPTTY